MSIADLMAKLVAALPERRGALDNRRTIREACLTLHEDGTWVAMAGGHLSVHIGEWGGDYQGEDATPEGAIAACLNSIQPQGA